MRLLRVGTSVGQIKLFIPLKLLSYDLSICRVKINLLSIRLKKQKTKIVKEKL